jgi:hypothetical protein
MALMWQACSHNLRSVFIKTAIINISVSLKSEGTVPWSHTLRAEVQLHSFFFYMEVSGQIHFPVTLLPQQYHSVPTERKGGCAPEPV